MRQLYLDEPYPVIKLRTDALSAITALLNRFSQKVTNHNFREMHKDVITEIESVKPPAKRNQNM